ncbi:hypothetical protein SprV_0501759100 [Sparganum proliferum]
MRSAPVERDTLAYNEAPGKESAQYTPFEDETRIVKGRIGSSFSTKVSLPGVFTTITYDSDKFSVVNQNCSSDLFNCSIIPGSSDSSTAIINGKMTEKLTFITFSGGNSLVPITVFFFNNNTWSDRKTGAVQPQYCQPLIVRAKGKRTVTLTCSMSGSPITYALYTSVNRRLYYQKKVLSTVNKVSEQPQIMNLEIRSILFHTVVTLTVKQNQSIDFYTCNNGDHWLTHTIDWTSTSGSATRNLFSAGLLIGGAAILLNLLGDSSFMPHF